MAEGPDNLVMICLRRLDAKVDRILEDRADVKSRLTAVEEALVRFAHRVDRLETPVDRMERRLDLVDMSH